MRSRPVRYVEAVKSLGRKIDAKGERLNQCSDLPEVCDRVTVFVDSKKRLYHGNSLKSKDSALLVSENRIHPDRIRSMD